MKITSAINDLPYYKKYLTIENATHDFFKNKKYLRLHLPLLSPSLIPESYVEVFETELRFLDKAEKLYLTPSPELFIKRLLTEGIGDCYYLDKAFRNSEGSSSLHNVEFTMLEFYKIGVDYSFIKKEIVALFAHIAEQVLGKKSMTVRGKHIAFDKPWEEISVVEAFKRYANIAEDELFDHKKFIKKVSQKGYVIKHASYIDLFSQIYTQEVEPHLGVHGVPTVIFDYPKEMAALAKLNPDGKTAQRFELYITGIELGDCYTELTDWKILKKRFEDEEKERKKNRKIAHLTDWGLIDAHKKGLPECAGMAIGFDRLSMIFARCEKIGELKLINLE